MKTQFKTYSDNIPASSWLPIFLPLLEEGKKIKISPQGYSMYPLIAGSRDTVILKKPASKIKKGDVVMFQRKNSQLVLHRIIRCKNNEYYLIGDSEYRIEGPVNRSEIYAQLESVHRKNRVITCRSLLYKVYSFLWLSLLPIRPLFFFVYRMFIHKKTI